MSRLDRWQDPFTLLLALWLLIAPSALHFRASASARYDSVLGGVLLVAVVLVAPAFSRRSWKHSCTAVLGAWLVCSPWVLGDGSMRAVVLSASISGVAILLVAVGGMMIDADKARSRTRLPGDL